MSFCQTSTLGFADFAAAASGVVAEAAPECPLVRIDRWLEACRPALARVREAAAAIDAAGAELFGERYHRGRGDIDAGAMARRFWELAVRALDVEFFKPQGLQVDADAFARAALQLSAALDPDNVHQEDNLTRWSRDLILTHFRKEFGDVREFASRQLRERVLSRSFGGDTRPGDVVDISSYLFSRDSSSRSSRSYEHANEERFADLVRYVIHVTTGEAPGDIVLPRFFGFNDGASRWDRAQLFKRQNAPFPGVRWLRFTADNYVQLALEAPTLSRIQAQWDAARTRGDAR